MIGLHRVQLLCEKVQISIRMKQKQGQYIPISSSVSDSGLPPKWKYTHIFYV